MPTPERIVRKTEWHRYKDKWYPGTMTCDAPGCETVKPEVAHPVGWWKRWRVKENRTERRCPEHAPHA